MRSTTPHQQNPDAMTGPAQLVLVRHGNAAARHINIFPTDLTLGEGKYALDLAINVLWAADLCQWISRRRAGASHSSQPRGRSAAHFVTVIRPALHNSRTSPRAG